MAGRSTALRGKVVLVAGGSSGVGRCFALQMAAQGARVAITARRAERLDAVRAEIEALGGTCLAIAADAELSEATASMVADVAAHFGAIDIVLLNAGGAPALDMRRMTADQVTAYMRSNYDVMVNTLFPVLAQMRAQGGGVVAHTNSLAGLVPVPMQGPYCAAKAAAKMLIDTCRMEFAPFGIEFVTVYPGFIATEATRDDGMPAPFELSEDDAARRIVEAIRRGKAHVRFPWQSAGLVRLAEWLPDRVRERMQRGEVPPMS